MSKQTKYVIISDAPPRVGLAWENALQESMGICHTIAKAYEIAKFLGGITKPDLKYRKVLDLIKKNGAVTVKQRVDTGHSATIIAVKIY